MSESEQESGAASEWQLSQSGATGKWYVNTGSEIWKCFTEDRARLVASAPRLQAEVESLRMALREIATLDADRWSIHRAVQIARVALTRGPAA